MQQRPDFDDFQGEWRLERMVKDHRGAMIGALSGHACFTPNLSERLTDYRESGELRTPDTRPLAASRHTVWRSVGTSLVVVSFADGREFHRFSLKQTMPGALYPCSPDLYHVTYDFTRWPEWRVTWRVQGPRKDYRMVSFYSP